MKKSQTAFEKMLAVYVQQKVKNVMVIITFVIHHHVYHSISFIFNYPENDFSHTHSIQPSKCVCSSAFNVWVNFKREMCSARKKIWHTYISRAYSGAVEITLAYYTTHRSFSVCDETYQKLHRRAFLGKRISGIRTSAILQKDLLVLKLFRSQKFPGIVWKENRRRIFSCVSVTRVASTAPFFR